jgi:hypothetical protein
VSESGDARPVEFTRFSDTVRAIRVEIDPAVPPPAAPDVLRLWNEMAADNTRLFNGPILAVDSVDFNRGVIRSRRDTYQRLVVQPKIATGVRQLSVTGVVLGWSVQREWCVLLGRRSTQTRMYAGMWELGPAGGLEPPADGTRVLDHLSVVDQLRREGSEEVGLRMVGRGEPIGVVYDSLAESYDVVLKVGNACPVSVSSLRPVGWEYQEIRWVPTRELREFEQRVAGEMIPPTREIIRSIDFTPPVRGELFES